MSESEKGHTPTTMRAALVTYGPAWPGDKEWTFSAIFSSTEHARRFFDSDTRNVLEIKPDYDSEYFDPFEHTWSRRPQ